jgi:zinc transporter, ZIP family
VQILESGRRLLYPGYLRVRFSISILPAQIISKFFSVDQLTDWFVNLSPVIQALVATCFTWFVTALGASFVFFFKTINRKVLDGMLGFAAGVMIAASFWSLLNPAIEMAEQTDTPSWIPAVVGFLAGGAFLWGVDKILPHLHLGFPKSEAEGIKTNWERSILLVLAITLHNIPEGLAVGVAFGAIATGSDTASLAGAVVLALGIGIQNFPEGVSVAVPLRREGFSRFKSFWYGQLSGIVEPIAGVAGALSVMHIQPILPYALSFAAGAMIFVVVEELIPESQLQKNTDIATVGAMLGFALMMALDVALG